MFRASQTLLFRPMQSLQTLKIHQPLPLNPRESQQLLTLLIASFRKQLDTEHPISTTHSKNDRTEHSARRKSFSGSEGRPTDRHMHSVLSNPLFNISPLHSKDGPIGIRSPMDTFEQAVAKGMMNTHYASTCLTAEKGRITESAVPNVRIGMKESGAGLRVLKWLIASGTTNDLGFLKDDAFTKILMEFIVAESLQEYAWAWIKKSFKSIPGLSLLPMAERKAASRNITRPLAYLISAEALNNTSLDDALLCMSRATGYLQGFPSKEMRMILGPPGRFLIGKMNDPQSQRLLVSETSFESFLSLLPVISKYTAFYLAQLSLLHPTRPTADPALAYIQNDGPLKHAKGSERKDKPQIMLCLDTADFLFKNSLYSDAEFVMQFIQENYQRPLGMTQDREVEQAKAEASTMQLLQGLGLA